jgi:hypothetical protein
MGAQYAEVDAITWHAADAGNPYGPGVSGNGTSSEVLMQKGYQKRNRLPKTKSTGVAGS